MKDETLLRVLTKIKDEIRATQKVLDARLAIIEVDIRLARKEIAQLDVSLRNLFHVTAETQRQQRDFRVVLGGRARTPVDGKRTPKR